MYRSTHALAFSLLAAACAADAIPPGSLHPQDAAHATRVGEGWLSGAANDYNLSLREDAGLLVFGRSPGGDFADAGIWIARLDQGRWSEPQRLETGAGGRRDSDPWLSPDGRWLYFVSDRAAPGREPGRTDLDLWRAPVNQGRVGGAEHLAAASSPGEELGPEVHDGWLSFNSTRSGGPARMALYRVRVDAVDNAQPEPLPAPFNDGLVQGDLTFSADGRVALFWSLRGDSRDPDLFAVARKGLGWGPAVRLPAPINAEGMDFTPAFSDDGRTLYWASQRAHTEHSEPPAGRADLFAIPTETVLSALGD